jgi:hypothetical protein
VLPSPSWYTVIYGRVIHSALRLRIFVRVLARVIHFGEETCATCNLDICDDAIEDFAIVTSNRSLVETSTIRVNRLLEGPGFCRGCLDKQYDTTFRVNMLRSCRNRVYVTKLFINRYIDCHGRLGIQVDEESSLIDLHNDVLCSPETDRLAHLGNSTCSARICHFIWKAPVALDKGFSSVLCRINKKVEAVFPW